MMFNDARDLILLTPHHGCRYACKRFDTYAQVLRAMQERDCWTLNLSVAFSPFEQTHSRRLVPFKGCLCS
jgi:hypothetical protein